MSDFATPAVTSWKKHVVLLTIALLSISFPIFLLTGYTALYWAWLRGDSQAALTYLPWARNSGMLAMVAAAAAIVILFSSNTFPIPAKTRVWLSLLATATIGFFSEFRNDGKFYLKNLIHFFGPGTWIHHALSRTSPSLADFLYRLEYAHWNDFLMGPAIVSVLFALVFVRIYGTFGNQNSISLTAPRLDASADIDASLRFARILMNVGLFWFFIQAWAEKAGYITNPHSSDEIDLPFEFAGTMLGFWMARGLTTPFNDRLEKFRSSLLIDFLSSGVIGLLYTVIVGPLTESVSSSVAHALTPVVPHSLDIHEYTPFQRNMRPLELLLLAGAMWWGLNSSFKHERIAQLSSYEEAESISKWDTLITMAKALAVTTGYLVIVVTMLSILEPEGLASTLTTAAAGMGVGTVAVVLVRRAERHGLTTVLARNTDTSSD